MIAVLMSVSNVASTKMTSEDIEFAETIDVSLPAPDFSKKNMAITYPFELDNFQKQAILKLEEGHHVFVMAHTSAGKTAVAEYAIALNKNNGTRSFYTSPNKALSNQKYNDFRNRFDSVGLLTGDFQINADANCMVMTTEVLMAMLHRGSDAISSLGCVVLDEVHYINDSQRGHVWEQLLILLPDTIQIVMLSATISNPLQFADWVGRIKNSVVYVVSTLKRPVPLRYYLYTGINSKTSNQLYQVTDDNNTFLVEGYNTAKIAKEKRGNDSKKFVILKGRKTSMKPEAETVMWNSLIRKLKQKDKLPVIAFVFSRKKCNILAGKHEGDLTTDEEKRHIQSFFETILQNLQEDNHALSQVTTLQNILLRGIGIHHSGLIPLLKETVEQLFARGLVKLLFATESFAVGVNMPARTVIFDEIEKYDADKLRLLTPAECVQMAGRAGRRGLDEAGSAIFLCRNGVPEQQSLHNVILGPPAKLTSHLHLNYSTILSLLLDEGWSNDNLIENSLVEYNALVEFKSKKRQLDAAERDYAHKFSSPLVSNNTPLDMFYEVAANYLDFLEKHMPTLLSQSRISKELVAGKILVISSGRFINQLAVYLNNKGPIDTPYLVLVLKQPTDFLIEQNFDVDDEWFRMLGLSAMWNFVGTEKTTLDHTIISIAPKDITTVTKTNISIDPDIILTKWYEAKHPRFKNVPLLQSYAGATLKKLSQLSLEARAGGRVVVKHFDLTPHLSIDDIELQALKRNMIKLEKELQTVRRYTDIDDFQSVFAEVYVRKRAERKIVKLSKSLALENRTLYPEYKNKYSILRELEYISKKHKITKKGAMASRMANYDIIVSELICSDVFDDCSPEEIAALLSSLVYHGKNKKKGPLTKYLKNSIGAIDKIERKLYFMERFKSIREFELHSARVNYGLVGVIYGWATLQPFSEIMKLTDSDEGTVVNCIYQLHELLVFVEAGATYVQSYELARKVREAAALIKRDIVCTPSLLEFVLDSAMVNYGLVGVIYEWATLEPCSEIMKLTDTDEMNCIHQLHELLIFVEAGATYVQNYELARNAHEAAALIKRDVACTPSLYASGL